MTEQELMQEALEWREHIAKLAADCSDQELFRKRLATFDWLIKQAERVQELERKIERYREALEFYADRENYKPDHYDPDSHDYTSMIDHDKGATARKALEGTK